MRSFSFVQRPVQCHHSSSSTDQGFFYYHIQHYVVNQSGIDPFLWILDNGAINHISPNKSSFSFLKKIKPIHVRLLNNSFSIAFFASDIHIGDLLLKNVLYIPNFSVHLVSIYKLLHTIDCLVLFCKSFCLIVQTSNFKVIGVAKQHHGLFHLQDSSDLKSFSFFLEILVLFWTKILLQILL